MRWKIKKSPVVGDKRTISYFALFPVTIQQDRRWLENVTILQERIELVDFNQSPHGIYDAWVDVKFIDQ